MKSFYQLIMKPIVVGIIILTMSITLTTILFMNKMITPDIEKLASSILNLKINEVDNWLSDHIKTTESIANSLSETSLTDDNRQGVINLLDTIQNKSSNEYESMGFITNEGEKYLTNGSHFNVSERDYYQTLLNSYDRTHLSMNIYSQANQAQVVLIVSKVFNDKNEVTGYISTALPINYIKETVTSSDKLYSTFIYHNRTDEALLGDIPPEKSLLEIDKPIPSNEDWRIKLSISRQNLLLSLDKTMLFVFIIGLVLTIFSMFIMKKRLGQITQPIEELDQKIADASDGTYLKIVPNTNISELNHIGRTYNNMVMNIDEQQNIIRKQSQQKNEAEQRALYAQIKPHFLYNTLQTIQAMAFDLDSIVIEEAIGELASFYRIGLSSDAQIITVAKECQHIKSYLNILLLRYESLFTYQIDNQVDPNELFLKFTIQPLVENAVYHGIKPLGIQGHIDIKIRESKENIYVQVINPAPMMTSHDIERINQLLKTNKANDSYGLFNVNQRLKLHFGKDYGVSIALEDGYFIVTTCQPKMRERN